MEFSFGEEIFQIHILNTYHFAMIFRKYLTSHETDYQQTNV